MKVTLTEVCYISGCNGGERLCDAMEFIVVNAADYIPKEVQRETLAELRESAKKYPPDMRLMDVIRAERSKKSD